MGDKLLAGPRLDWLVACFFFPSFTSICNHLGYDRLKNLYIHALALLLALSFAHFCLCWGINMFPQIFRWGSLPTVSQFERHKRLRMWTLTHPPFQMENWGGGKPCTTTSFFSSSSFAVSLPRALEPLFGVKLLQGVFSPCSCYTSDFWVIPSWFYSSRSSAAWSFFCSHSNSLSLAPSLPPISVVFKNLSSGATAFYLLADLLAISSWPELLASSLLASSWTKSAFWQRQSLLLYIANLIRVLSIVWEKKLVSEASRKGLSRIDALRVNGCLHFRLQRQTLFPPDGILVDVHDW